MAEFDADLESSRVAKQVESTADRARDGFARVGDVTGRAASADGAIRVAVAPGGMLTDVKVSPVAFHAGMDHVAREIVQLAHSATRRAGDRMYRAMAPALGPEGEEHLASLGYQPLPEDPEDEADGPGDVDRPIIRGR